MILMNFGLWWSGASLSYLRYLTFKSLRHFHKYSRIQLFTSKKCRKDAVSGNPEQEYCGIKVIKDYSDKLKDLGVEIVEMNMFEQCFPYQQADLYRWIFLKRYGGIYLDPDQIILRSFSSLPLKDYDFMYSSYKVDSPYAHDGEFSPIGVLGADPKSKVVDYVTRSLGKKYVAADYNALGVMMMHDVKNKIEMHKSFNAPSHYFYPAPICNFMEGIYNGTSEIYKDSYSIHWYGGFAPSQEFNVKYTEEFAKTSEDSISRKLRELKIL